MFTSEDTITNDIPDEQGINPMIGILQLGLVKRGACLSRAPEETPGGGSSGRAGKGRLAELLPSQAARTKPSRQVAVCRHVKMDLIGK